MGHFTVLADDVDAALAAALAIKSQLTADAQQGQRKSA